jgi:7,8-dihydropterin-6-yl-methyl-4-(beta-D-ribofuranosyl)aminobenzene 5'-phosphate synthase
MKLTIIVDNQPDKQLGCEHGYCLHIQDGPTQLLLDTGQSKLLVDNAHNLGIDLAAVDHLILSHGHYDHTGGMSYLMEINPEIQIHLHRDCELERFSRDSDKIKPVGIEKKAHKALQHHPAEKLHWINSPTPITERIHLTGPVPRKTAFETTGGDFYLERECQNQDLLHDDQSLFIETGKGLVICLGCCHSGIINTIDYITRIHGTTKIAAVIGGMHLVNSNLDRLEQTVARLSQYDIGLIVACHCTGEDASRYLEANLDIPVKIGHSGFSLSF